MRYVIVNKLNNCKLLKTFYFIFTFTEQNKTFFVMKKKDIKIYLIDYEQDILEIVGYNLSQEGYQIVTASNGKEAILKAKKELPQLIIMDVMMPEMDGMEACENIRKIPELQDTIITFLTARSEDYSQVAGFDAGADDYIAKPIKPKVLVSKVQALLRRLKGIEGVSMLEILKLIEKNIKSSRMVWKLFYLVKSLNCSIF